MDKYTKEKYHLIRKLGEGAFGSVFLVKRKDNDKELALKKIVIKETKKEPLEMKLEKANSEINILKDIAKPECNPNLSCYLDHTIIKTGKNAFIYLEMEFIDGYNIDQYIAPFLEENHEILLKLVYILIKSICLGLKSIHDKNILHQDIKPENIIVDKNTNIPILVDFGLSCITKEKGEDNCIFDKCCKSGGTVEYMAPERIFAESKVGYPKSDVWSLGATVYYIIFRKHIRDPGMIQIAKIEKLNTGIKLLDNLINGMTEKNIDERFSVDFILEMLKDI